MRTKIEKAFRYFMSEVVGTENQTMAYFCLAAIAGILFLSAFLGSGNMNFQGVAGSRELNINFEYAVEIKRVHVIPGQKVKKGDLLLELSQSDLNNQIRQLQALLAKLRAERSVRDQLNRAVGNDLGNPANDPLSIEIRDTEEELAILNRQRNNLYVFSEADGIVGSVNFRRGEKAPSFSPLVTVSSESPTFVQGFIHEKMHSQVLVGTKVDVVSLTNSGYETKGKVVSVGSRIVEMPPRMSNMQVVPVWGREVTIQIPASTQFLLGERVQISPSFSFLPGFIAQADENEWDEANVGQPRLVNVSNNLGAKTNFEPSGAIYLSDMGKYLVISDDTDNANTPFLFLMTKDGEVDEQLITVPGVPELADLESISSDGNYIYLMTSLSQKNKGKLNEARNLFVRMKRVGLEMREVQTINLGVALRQLIAESTNPMLVELRRNGTESLQVEAHSVKGGDLFIAIKEPILEGDKTVILRMPEVAKLFEKKKPTLEVWNAHSFEWNNQLHQVSDMTFRDNGQFFLTLCKHGPCGALWKVAPGSSDPKMVRSFTDLHPEGLAFDDKGENLLITFDEGLERAQFLRVPVSKLMIP